MKKLWLLSRIKEKTENTLKEQGPLDVAVGDDTRKSSDQSQIESQPSHEYKIDNPIFPDSSKGVTPTRIEVDISDASPNSSGINIHHSSDLDANASETRTEQIQESAHSNQEASSENRENAGIDDHSIVTASHNDLTGDEVFETFFPGGIIRLAYIYAPPLSGKTFFKEKIIAEVSEAGLTDKLLVIDSDDPFISNPHSDDKDIKFGEVIFTHQELPPDMGKHRASVLVGACLLSRTPTEWATLLNETLKSASASENPSQKDDASNHEHRRLVLIISNIPPEFWNHSVLNSIPRLVIIREREQRLDSLDTERDVALVKKYFNDDSIKRLYDHARKELSYKYPVIILPHNGFISEILSYSSEFNALKLTNDQEIGMLYNGRRLTISKHSKVAKSLDEWIKGEIEEFKSAADPQEKLKEALDIIPGSPELDHNVSVKILKEKGDEDPELVRLLIDVYKSIIENPDQFKEKYWDGYIKKHLLKGRKIMSVEDYIQRIKQVVDQLLT